MKLKNLLISRRVARPCTGTTEQEVLPFAKAINAHLMQVRLNVL